MSELPKDKKEKKDKPRTKKSETIPIPDPPAQKSVSPSRPPPGFGVEPPSISVGSRQTRTYSVEQLLVLQDDPKLQDPAKGLKLPDKINRKLLDPALRKRKYPFVTENGRRKNDQSRWDQQKGKWRDSRNGKGRKDASTIDDIEEVEETDEQRDPNEPEPDWADADEEIIKRDIRSFQFQALDREEEREMFATTGQVPDKPKLAKIQKVEKKANAAEANNLDSLFRKAKTANMPQLPENAVDANQLEKGQALGGSLFSNDMGQKSRDEAGPTRSLGLFDFARDPSRNLSTRPIGDHLGRGRDEYGGRGLGDRALGGDIRRSPNAPHPDREETGRIADFDLNKFAEPQNSGPEKGNAESSTPPDADQGISDRDRTGYSAPQKPMNMKSIKDPGQRLENILYEVTDPVRPCVGGQFFAAARPLTNKELYDYSPKFKEIQDTRHKQMMRHSMQQQRKRIMMEKYAQAKRMYEKYPPQSRGMGHSDKMYDHRRMMDYRSRDQGYPNLNPSDYDYMKRSVNRPPADPMHYQ